MPTVISVLDAHEAVERGFGSYGSASAESALQRPMSPSEHRPSRP